MRVLPGTAAAALVVMLVSFLIGLARKRHDGVDVGWGLGFAVVAMVGLALSAGHGEPAMRWLVTAMTVVWGLRLSTHIALRQRGAPPDKRYEELLADFGPLRALRKVYLTQGVVLWFVAMPVQVALMGVRSPGGL